MSNLNKLIKLYAYLISNETDLGFRIQVHDMICDFLDIPKKEFKPFEEWDYDINPTFEDCIILIQNSINQLKRNGYIHTEYNFYKT